MNWFRRSLWLALFLCALSAGAQAACTPSTAPSFATLLETQNADRVKVTGGCIDGTPIGQNTPAAGAFTDLTINGVAGMNATASNATLPDALGNLGLRTPASCDGFSAADGAITSGTTTFTSASANFTTADVGKPISVAGAGAAGVNLVTTIASRNSATSVVLAAAASATVSGANWGYGTDYSAVIQAAVAAGVQLPSGVCGQASGITIGSKDKLLGQGSSIQEGSRTILLWLGAVGGTQVTIGDGVAQRTGMIFGNVELDGNCAAATGAEIKDIAGGNFPPIFARRHTTRGVYANASVADGGVKASDFFAWKIREAQSCNPSAKGMVWGPGDPGNNTNVNGLRFWGLSIDTQNGTALECGNADSNRVYGFVVSRTGTATGIDMLGSNVSGLGHCRNNFFDFGGTPPVVARGTGDGYSQPAINNELKQNIDGGAAVITVGAGASAFGYRTDGRPIGDWSPGRFSAIGYNPTGTTSDTSVMMGFGAGTAGSTATVFTPKRSGVVTFTVYGRLVNSTANTSSTATLQYGTGSPPAHGAASTGTTCSPNVIVTPPANNAFENVTLTCNAALTVGTAYWWDVSLKTQTATTTTATIAGSGATAVEQ